MFTKARTCYFGVLEVAEGHLGAVEVPLAASVAPKLCACLRSHFEAAISAPICGGRLLASRIVRVGATVVPHKTSAMVVLLKRHPDSN